MAMDRLTGQLSHLPEIIGRLGLNIAEAQKEFNADYLVNIKALMELANEALGNANPGDEVKAVAMMELLKSIAPSRYQFTEAEIDFRADLAEALDVSGQVGIAVGTPAIAVNAALALGYGYDYRAAAHINAKIQAFPASPDMAKTLIARAKELDNSDDLALPEKRRAVDNEIKKSMNDISKAVGKGFKETPAIPAGAPAAGGGD